jgi:hypothetical protein
VAGRAPHPAHGRVVGDLAGGVERTTDQLRGVRRTGVVLRLGGQQGTEAGRRAAAEPSESDGSDGSATLHILGRTADPDTRRLREWATAHQVTSTIVDLDDDPGACELLAELGLAPDAAPIAVWHEQAVQRASTDDLADLQHKRSPGG